MDGFGSMSNVYLVPGYGLVEDPIAGQVDILIPGYGFFNESIPPPLLLVGIRTAYSRTERRDFDYDQRLTVPSAERFRRDKMESV